MALWQGDTTVVMATSTITAITMATAMPMVSTGTIIITPGMKRR